MPKMRARGADEAPSLQHRAVVGVLVVANLAACIASFFCLRLLGRVETDTSFHVPKVDLSGLYDEPARKTALSRPVAVHGSLGSAFGKATSAVLPNRLLLPMAQRLFLQGKGGTKRDAPAPAPAPTPVVVLDAPKTGDEAASPDGFASCRAPVHGQMPTTACRRPELCTWESVKGKFLSGYSADVEFNYPLEVAKKFCMDLGPLCVGVSCDMHSARCTARSGTELLHSRTGEMTHVKRCRTTLPPISADGCDGSMQPARPTPTGASQRKDLHGAAIVVLAHSRADDLRTCLKSLLRLPDVGIFELQVSLDDAAAEPSMRETVKELAREHNTDIGVWLQPEVEVDPQKHNQEQQRWFKMNTGKIAHHYWMAFEKTFMEHKYENAIFVEEDLVFSPDFLALFRSTAWLLDEDPSLGCVSAWNDFGSSGSATDPCRLLRSSYFPGLGFLLQRSAWLRLREAWPIAPTMGWDYWMRVAFRREGKECIIPEVSRSHHVGANGSSVTHKKALKLLKLMAFSQLPTSCNATEPCQHFGDVSYLMSKTYEEWVLRAISQGHRITKEELAPALKPEVWYVLPFVREDLGPLAEKLGLVPKGTRNAIPADLRSEHYGVLVTTHVVSRARVILVDRRSPRVYLPDVAMRPSSLSVAVAGAKNESCTIACSKKGLSCDAKEMDFLNNCSSLEKHFACEGGCAHQVGKELPVYVPDDFQPTYRQCLVTFISKMNCEAHHASTARLCACVPGQSSAAGHKMRGL